MSPSSIRRRLPERLLWPRGCSFLGALYAFLVIAVPTKDRFGAVLAIGVGLLLFWHALLNLGMATGFLTVAGDVAFVLRGRVERADGHAWDWSSMNVSMRRYYVVPSRTTTLLVSV